VQGTRFANDTAVKRGLPSRTRSMPRFLAVPILDFGFWILDWELASWTQGLVFLRFLPNLKSKIQNCGCCHLNGNILVQLKPDCQITTVTLVTESLPSQFFRTEFPTYRVFL